MSDNDMEARFALHREENQRAIEDDRQRYRQSTAVMWWCIAVLALDVIAIGVVTVTGVARTWPPDAVTLWAIVSAVVFTSAFTLGLLAFADRTLCVHHRRRKARN